MYLRSHEGGRALRLALPSVAVAAFALGWLAPADTQDRVVASALAVGRDHFLVLGSDGVVWSWGLNLHGQLGDASRAPRTNPAPVLEGARAIAAGPGKSGALLSTDNSLWAWGDNSHGQLGTLLGERLQPGRASGLPPLGRVAFGRSHALGLDTRGVLWSWGVNDQEQLGRGGATTTPQQLKAVGMVTAICAGESHSIALQSDGSVLAWGLTADAQTGVEGNVQPEPSLVAGLPRVSAIACGSNHNVVIASDGSVLAWGRNFEHQVGDPWKTRVTEPLAIDAVRGASAAAAGRAHTLALRDGVVWAWGDNSKGQLGSTTLDESAEPVAVGGLPKITSIAAGGDYSLVAAVDGSIWVWGGGPKAQAGRAQKAMDLIVQPSAGGNTVATPVLNPGSGTYPTDAVQITCSTSGAFIYYTTNGDIPTEGDNQIASGASVNITVSATLKAKAFKTGMTPSAVAQGVYTLKVATPTFNPLAGTIAPQNVFITTNPTQGATIYYTTDGVTDPTPSSNLYNPATGVSVTQSLTLKARGFRTGWTTSDQASGAYTIFYGAIGAGFNHSLAVRPSDSTVWAWGRGSQGQLGDGLTGSVKTLPTQIAGITAKAVAGGEEHTLFLYTNGEVWGVGKNDKAQLGDRSQTTPRLTPVKAYQLSSVSRISAGQLHSLAVKSSESAVYVWGDNTYGQLGDGTRTLRNKPTKLTSPTGAVDVEAGESHSLGLTSDNRVIAWGRNSYGQVGNGTSGSDQLSPVQVATGVKGIAAGARHSLAVKTDGSVLAWGDNSYSQAGPGAGGHTPLAVTGLTGVLAVAAADRASFALKNDGKVLVWGSDAGGALISATPVEVVGPANIVAIAAGQFHALFLSSDGTIWSLGYNVYGQLGVGNTAQHTNANKVTEPGFAWKSPTPTLSVTSGTLQVGAAVVITVADGSAALHYTMNAGDPTTADPTAVGSGCPACTKYVNVNVPGTLRVRAFSTGLAPSNSAVGTYQLKLFPPNWTANSPVGPRTVTFTNSTVGTTIHYNTDGYVPTTADPSVPNGGTVLISRTSSIQAFAVKAGYVDSNPSGAGTLTINYGTLSAPTASPSPGTYPAPPEVALSTSTSDATIRYTLDGTTPTWRSPQYSVPIVLPATTTVKALAFKNDWNPSSVATLNYTVNTAVAPPAFTPNGGSFTTKQTVAVSCGTAGSLAYYTTNGLDPTTADTPVACGGTLVVDQSLRLKLKAFLGQQESTVRTADFFITGAISAGPDWAMALKTDGSVWTWGWNFWGNLGDGSTTERWVPGQVVGVNGVGFLSDIVAIAAGTNTALAVKRDGTVYMWGNWAKPGSQGVGSYTPVLQTSLSNVIAVAAATEDFVALKSDGTVWTFDRSSGASLDAGGIHQSVAMTGADFMALKTDGATSGTLWKKSSGSPAQAGLHDLIGLGAGGPSFVITTDRRLLGWGSNSDGQLGDGTTVSPSRFTQALIAQPTVAQVEPGFQHTLTLLQDGSVWAFGQNLNRELGTEFELPYDTSKSTVPIQSELPVPAIAVSGGSYFSMALGEDGQVWTWGQNGSGKLGRGYTGGFEAQPAPVLTVANNSFLAVDSDGDGLTNAEELALGSDPSRADTNGDGLSDSAAHAAGLSLTDPDMDDDGALNAAERQRGTDPFGSDTDSDGANDFTDCFPLDPTRTSCPTGSPSDTTPPTITLTEPTNAVLQP